MRFSTTIEYAIHGLVYLAVRDSGSTVLAGDIAKAICVPESYLRKVFQLLSRAGLVTSHRGAKGGFSLARDAGEVSLKDVVEAIDGTLPVYACMKATRKCTVTDLCPVSEAFEAARGKMAEVLEASSIKDLARGIARRSASWIKVTECA